MSLPFTYTLPIINSPNSTEEPKVTTALSQLLSWGNSQALTLIEAPPTGTHWAMDFGVVLVNGPFGTGSNAPYSNLTTVNHNLGVMPQYIFTMPTTTEVQVAPVGVVPPYPYASSTGSPTSTTFSVQGKIIAGGYVTTDTWGSQGLNPLPVFWVAIGPKT